MGRTRKNSHSSSVDWAFPRLVFQEIVQNADDAGAKDVIFLLDETDYGCEKGLLLPKLKRYQVRKYFMGFRGERLTQLLLGKNTNPDRDRGARVIF